MLNKKKICKNITKGMLCTMTAAMVVGMPYFAHAENFGTRFDEGTHLGSYYNVAL